MMRLPWFKYFAPNSVAEAAHILAAEGKDPRVGPESFPAVPYPEPVFVLPPSEGGDGKETIKVARPAARSQAEVAAS